MSMHTKPGKTRVPGLKLHALALLMHRLGIIHWSQLELLYLKNIGAVQ